MSVQEKGLHLGGRSGGFERQGNHHRFAPCFPRDGAKKVYVQHRLIEEPERIYEDLITKGGYFYLCGQAGQLEVDVKNALVTCFEKGGGVSREEGQKMLQ